VTGAVEVVCGPGDHLSRIKREPISSTVKSSGAGGRAVCKYLNSLTSLSLLVPSTVRGEREWRKRGGIV